MTAPLEPELAAAYVRELSADVVAVVVLGADGALLAGEPSLAAAAARLAAELPGGGVVTTARGTGWVARTPERALVAVARPGSGPGPTAVDVAAAIGAAVPPEPVRAPSAALERALEAVIPGT